MIYYLLGIFTGIALTLILSWLLNYKENKSRFKMNDKLTDYWGISIENHKHQIEILKRIEMAIRGK